MKELKFRAWNIKECKMWEASTIQEISERWCFSKDSLVIEQFTGLKDINGVDVYEGDVVKVLEGHESILNTSFTIGFEKGSFTLIEKSLKHAPTTIGYYFYGCVKNDVFESYNDCNGSVFEVIGNIHK